MNAHLNRTATLALLSSLALFGLASRSPAAQSQAPQTTRAASTNAGRAAAKTEIPQSVFNPVQGRNPFFPQSTAPVPHIAQPIQNSGAAATPVVGASDIILNGITPDGPKRTAMINSRTFEAGESGEIKLPNGRRTMIKCEEIRSESVIILVDGQKRELKLRFGL